MLQRAGKIRLRGDFLPWSVLKEMRRAPHPTFVELVKQTFFSVLSGVVHLHVLEERFARTPHSMRKRRSGKILPTTLPVSTLRTKPEKQPFTL
jgi:hypothetical protein